MRGSVEHIQPCQNDLGIVFQDFAHSIPVRPGTAEGNSPQLMLSASLVITNIPTGLWSNISGLTCSGIAPMKGSTDQQVLFSYGSFMTITSGYSNRISYMPVMA